MGGRLGEGGEGTGDEMGAEGDGVGDDGVGGGGDGGGGEGDGGGGEGDGEGGGIAGIWLTPGMVMTDTTETAACGVLSRAEARAGVAICGVSVMSPAWASA